jgi:hypothetical protein
MSENEKTKLVMFRLPKKELETLDKTCPKGRRAERLREIVEQSNRIWEGQNQSGAASFDLEAAKAKRVKLSTKIEKIKQLLGGNQTRGYYAMEMLCSSLGLKTDYSNLDSVMVQLIDYKPQESDSFSLSDLAFFRDLLELMSEQRTLRLKIDAEIKRLRAS